MISLELNEQLGTRANYIVKRVCRRRRTVVVAATSGSEPGWWPPSPLPSNHETSRVVEWLWPPSATLKQSPTRILLWGAFSLETQNLSGGMCPRSLCTRSDPCRASAILARRAEQDSDIRAKMWEKSLKDVSKVSKMLEESLNDVRSE
jgi:hypothetical protein